MGEERFMGWLRCLFGRHDYGCVGCVGFDGDWKHRHRCRRHLCDAEVITRSASPPSHPAWKKRP